MPKNNTIVSKDPLPDNFTTLEDLWEFWDTHSSADYEEFMEPVEAEIDLSSEMETKSVRFMSSVRQKMNI